MDIDKIRKMLKNKTKVITVKLNPDLVALLDKTIEADEDLDSRNEFFEKSILEYLSNKGLM